MKRLSATLPRFPRPGLYGKEVQQQGEDESQVCKYSQRLMASAVQEGTLRSNNGSLKATAGPGHLQLRPAANHGRRRQ